MQKVRQSNIELLRIVAMFLVLVVHADFLALNIPTHDEMATEPLSSTVRLFMQSISIVCANVFVLISGWFGIRPSVKGVCKFLFQCFFFLLGAYVFFYFYNGTRLSFDYLFMKGDYWFVKSYIGLLIVAPLMNAFIERATKKQLMVWLICFYVFQSIYGGFVSHGADFFMGGYSTISFMGLYVLARYVRLYPPSFKATTYIGIYFIIAVCMTFLSVMLYKYIGNPDIVEKLVGKLVACYTNPLTVLASLCLLLAFSKMQFHSKFINWMAASSFAVYLLQWTCFW